METLKLDGQEITILHESDWVGEEFSTLFSSWLNCDIESNRKWFERNSKYNGLILGVIGPKGRCLPIAIVEVDGEKHRVHIENVICEHCKKRSGISGSPGHWELYTGCSKPREVMSRSMELPVKLCKHCGGKLKRRHTIWFETEGLSLQG